MSSISYTKLFGIEVLHDYYLFNGQLLSSYNILEDLDFIPMPSTAILLRNLKCIFKKNTKGFDVFVRANGSTTFIYIEPDVKFQFLITVKNPYFFNFTNLRLTENRGKLYRFANTAAESELSFPFLHRDIRGFTATDSSIEFGDLLVQGGNLLEAITNAPNSINENNFIINSNATSTNYVTIQDRINWQYPTFRFQRNALPAGETIIFEFKDEKGNVLDLGAIPNTGGEDEDPQPQSETMVSSDGIANHSIDLSGFSPGLYEMSIQSDSINESVSFFLFDPVVQANTFGIIEIYANSAIEDYKFVNHQFIDDSDNAPLSVIEEKAYQIKFKNRTTQWQFLDQTDNELIFHEPNAPNTPINTRRALTKAYVNIENIENDTLPNPNVAFLYPERDETRVLINEIYSKIYLVQQ